MAQDKVERIKELVEILNEAAKAYYAQDTEIMSNFEYDRLYDELVPLEGNRCCIIQFPYCKRWIRSSG